jgi:hypothetical protein
MRRQRRKLKGTKMSDKKKIIETVEESNDVVKSLEALLAAAKKGHISAFCFVGQMGLQTQYVVVNDKKIGMNLAAMLGGLSIAKTRIRRQANLVLDSIESFIQSDEAKAEREAAERRARS